MFLKCHQFYPTASDAGLTSGSEKDKSDTAMQLRCCRPWERGRKGEKNVKKINLTMQFKEGFEMSEVGERKKKVRKI